jgi:hypothetical protein
MSIFEKISKLGLILISSVFIQKFEFFISITAVQILLHNFLSAEQSLFPSPFHFGSPFDLHNSIRRKQPFGLTGLTGCLPPSINPDATRLRLSATTGRCHATASSYHPSA